MSRPRVDRPAALALASVAAALVLLPAGLTSPGFPLALGPDQLTHLAASISLTVDGDLRCGPEDLDRLFQAFPYAGDIELIMRPVDDGGPPSFAADPLFTLVSSPIAGFVGLGGVLALVAAWFVTAIACVAVPRRSSDTGDVGSALGLGPTLAFFLVSAAFVYAVRVHPATLHAALVAAACAARFGSGGPPWRANASGLCLGLAVVPVPILLPLTPALALGRPDRRIAWAGSFVTGAVTALGLAALLGMAPFADGPAAPYTFTSPYDHAALEAPAPPAETPGEPDLAAPWIPLRAVGLALFERRTGLLPYIPFAAVLWIAWLVDPQRRRRSLLGFGLLASIAAIAGSPALASDDPGGYSFADPRLVAVYPAFAFLLTGKVSARRRGVTTVVGTLLGVLSLGPAMVSLLGPAMAWGSPQGHTRGWLAHLPLASEHIGRGGELEPFQLVDADGPRLWRPRHATEVHGDEIWILGGQTAELFLDTAETATPDAWVLQMRSFAAGNRVRIHFGDDTRTLDFAGELPGAARGVDGTTRRTVEPGAGSRLRSDDGGRRLWPLRITTSAGVRPSWLGERSRYYVGLGLSILGSPSDLERDVYGVEWRACSAPETVVAGGELLALVRLANTSEATWPNAGAARVRLGHRWLDKEDQLVATGPRFDFDRPIAPADEVAAWIRATAPTRPGRYTLEIGPLFENVAWFADREVTPCRLSLDVGPQSASGDGSSGTR